MWDILKFVLESINKHHINPTRFKNKKMPESIKACTDFDKAVAGAELKLEVELGQLKLVVHSVQHLN